MLNQLVGNYRIVEEIGKGGMGVVYRAVHQRIEAQVVAVKHLAPLLIFGDQCTSERAASEAASQAKLRGHPHIVSLYDYVENESGLFLIMEYIAGVSGIRNLAELVRARGALPLDEIKRLFGQILSAVGFAHQHGIIHRDLKPLNIMLSEFGAKVGDFGIARIVSGDTSVSVSGHRVGTPAYMSPEQVLDKKLTRATDIYSLGCTLYEATTGKLPFKASETSSFFEAHLQEPPIPPRSVNPALPEQLEHVILKAMEKKPVDRFQTCEEFAAALADAAVAKPQPTPQPTPPPDVTQPEPPAPISHHPSPITPHPPLHAHRSPPSPSPKRRRKAVWMIGLGLAGVVAIVVIAALVRAPRSSLSVQRSLGLNPQGFEEILWLKDSSVMIRIPAGTFTMGSNECDDEKPVHQVYLDEYYIDKYEVTNDQYKKFCDATGRSYPPDPDFLGMPNYFASYPSYPVVNVSWNDAKAYCDWAGKRLPTEAEWEKAARGADAREYSWGNSEPTGSRCNFADKNTSFSWRDANADDGYARTAPVGTYPAGASPYGCLDMAGNVWEWCSDRYDANYYNTSPSNNPQGPSSGSYRVLRGGSWIVDARTLRCASRVRNAPSHRYSNLGFRCSCRQ